VTSSLPSPSRVITLLTDFGHGDPFVGIMKGVIASLCIESRVIDLCHGIQPQAVAEAAFWLERSYAWFPPGSLHVAVVDPTVGSERRILAVAALGHYFLAPDNGLLADALTGAEGARVHALDFARLGLHRPSATFHGRDVFAPVAARLASGGLELAAVGPPVLAQPCVLRAPESDGQMLTGEVVTVDRFGNLITNLDRARVESSRAHHVTLAGRDITLRRTYADAAPGELLALINAFDVLEVAQRDGNAEQRLGLGRQTPVQLPLSSVQRA
jgi:S-adenosyl-L-methionine hydrolase (adenosine-forming)